MVEALFEAAMCKNILILAFGYLLGLSGAYNITSTNTYMNEKDIKKIHAVVEARLKADVSKEEALNSLVAAGILRKDGKKHTKPYSVLDTVWKHS